MANSTTSPGNARAAISSGPPRFPAQDHEAFLGAHQQLGHVSTSRNCGDDMQLVIGPDRRIERYGDPYP